MSLCGKIYKNYELVKRCSKPGIVLFKTIFYKDRTKTDDLHSHCKFCRKKIQKKYQMKVRKKTNIHVKNTLKQLSIFV